MEVHVLGSHCLAARQQMQLTAAVQVGWRGGWGGGVTDSVVGVTDRLLLTEHVSVSPFLVDDG